MPLVGTPVPRLEAPDKVTGAACYVDDFALPGMIYGVTVRSPGPRGRIRRIRLGDGIPWEEITVVTARDIPGDNVVALINDDQPCLAAEVYNHAEEAVVLLAHRDRALLERARRQVHLDVEPLPPVLTIDDALAAREVIWGTDNIIKSYLVEQGDVEAALREADLVVQGEYETGAQEHLYIEPNGMVAVATPEDGVTVWGSLQCPYYVQKALMRLFRLPPERTRVVQLETGGGFGGKEDYPSMIAAHAALLSWKAGGVPVKIVYDRTEDMLATTKRHPSRTRHRTGLRRDGTLVALDIDFVIDGGAYSTLSQVVLSRGTIHAAGPYRCDNVRIRGRAVATNTPPRGAFRGFGAPQSLFALERHLDVVARAAGLPPEELRRRNFIRRGERLAVGQQVRDGVDLPALLERALQVSGWTERKNRFRQENQRGTIRRGLGLSCFLHGTGFTGSGESHLASTVALEGTAEGRVRVLTSSTEIGQGTNTIFSQIAADALGVGGEIIEVPRPDTAAVPDSGPTVASRTCTIVGKLIETAALSLRQQLLEEGLLPLPYTTGDFQAACAAYVRQRGALRATARYQPPPGIHWDEVRFRGDAYGAYSWAVYVAQVRVDLCTYQAQVEEFWTVQEVGRVVNPTLAAGQIEGGVAQAIGWALYEHVAWQEGRMANCRMTDYIIPTTMDIPPIHVWFEEAPYPYGAFGAKGLGELPMDGPAPAILNAIHDALGVSICRVPATPEVIYDALSREEALV